MKVIKIGASWCPSCFIMKPLWETLEKENDWLKTEFYDFDEDENKIQKYNLEEDILPVFIFLDKDNNEIKRINGEFSKKELQKIITELKDK